MVVHGFPSCLLSTAFIILRGHDLPSMQILACCLLDVESRRDSLSRGLYIWAFWREVILLDMRDTPPFLQRASERASALFSKQINQWLFVVTGSSLVLF